VTIPKDNIWAGYASTNCKGIWGWLFGHKYRARFDSSLPKNRDIKGTTKYMEACKTKIYRGDVCKRCGNNVNTQGNA